MKRSNNPELLCYNVFVQKHNYLVKVYFIHVSCNMFFKVASRNDHTSMFLTVY